MPFHAVEDGTGFQMNYEVYPNLVPRTTLMIHGNIASNRWWHPTLEVLQQQSSSGIIPSCSGSIVLAEFRGCGKSSPPTRPEEIDIGIFVRDFISLIEKLKLGPIHIVGHSTGGLIAALMLAQAPHLFERAILLDPVGARGVQFDPALTAIFERMKTRRDLVAQVLNSTIYKNDPQSHFFQNILVSDALTAVQNVGAGVIRALSQIHVEKKCATIAHKVLVLHGEHDQLLPVEDSRKLAELIPEGVFESIPNQGHCLNVENPTLFVEIMSKFFAFRI